ncbi:MAG TPA: hypothetical protein VGN17_19135 [Bryobacteraceae bacterium]|jgi:hypothetical protein
MTENETIARRRADQVAEILRGLGVSPPLLKVRIVPDVTKPEGVTDSRNRSLTIRVSP